MSLIFAEYGLKNALEKSVYGSGGAGVGMYCRLFTNNYTPLESSVVSDFTQATFTGYAAIQLTSWSTPAYSSGKARTSNAVITFTNTGGSSATIYGYYVTDSGNTNLFFAERDPLGPITLNPGDSYAITIEVTGDNP